MEYIRSFPVNMHHEHCSFSSGTNATFIQSRSSMFVADTRCIFFSFSLFLSLTLFQTHNYFCFEKRCRKCNEIHSNVVVVFTNEIKWWRWLGWEFVFVNQPRSILKSLRTHASSSRWHTHTHHKNFHHLMIIIWFGYVSFFHYFPHWIKLSRSNKKHTFKKLREYYHIISVTVMQHSSRI